MYCCANSVVNIDVMTNRAIRIFQSESSEIDPDIIAMVVIAIVLLGVLSFLYTRK